MVIVLKIKNKGFYFYSVSEIIVLSSIILTGYYQVRYIRTLGIEFHKINFTKNCYLYKFVIVNSEFVHNSKHVIISFYSGGANVTLHQHSTFCIICCLINEHTINCVTLFYKISTTYFLHKPITWCVKKN